MTSLDKIERAPVAAPATAGNPRNQHRGRIGRDAEAGCPHRADAAWADRDDDDRSRLDRTPRGCGGCRGGAGAHRFLHRLYFRYGIGVQRWRRLPPKHFGARDPRLVRRSLRVGLWAALLISLPMMVLPLFGEQILLALGQAPATSRLAQHYLLGLAWGITPALSFLAIRGFMGAVNRPEPGLWITLAAIPANAVLVYLLIHGKLGLPRLELFGAGLATTIVNFGMFLAGIWFAYARRPFRKYHVLGRIWRLDWMLMRQLVMIGAPISLAFLMEYGLFAAAALLMGLISTTALAAHQIALQVTAILFMVPFGIGMAATVRVGHAVGRNDALAVKRAGFVATLLGMVLVSALTVTVILTRFAIATIFLRRGC